jgi:hypothetical protein
MNAAPAHQPAYDRLELFLKVYNEAGELIAQSMNKASKILNVSDMTIKKYMTPHPTEPNAGIFIMPKSNKVTWKYNIINENNEIIAESMEELSDKTNIDMILLYDYIEDVDDVTYRYTGPMWSNRPRLYLIRHRDALEEEIINEELY